MLCADRTWSLMGAGQGRRGRRRQHASHIGILLHKTAMAGIFPPPVILLRRTRPRLCARDDYILETNRLRSAIESNEPNSKYLRLLRFRPGRDPISSRRPDNSGRHWPTTGSPGLWRGSGGLMGETANASSTMAPRHRHHPDFLAIAST